MFLRFRLSVSEVIRERLSSAFQFFEDAFDGVPILMDDMLEPEAEMVTGRLQSRRTIDRKDHVRNEMFFADLVEEHLGECGGSGREEPDV
jgi:hypothetical protein